MRITIRTRELQDGNRSIYLDCIDGKRRWQEFLNLFLVPESGKEEKRLNEAMMAKANVIKSRRMLGIEDEPAEEGGTVPRRVFADWLDTYLLGVQRSPLLSTSTYKNQLATVNIIKAYLKSKRHPRLLMSKIDKKFALGFNDFLTNTYTNDKSPDNPLPLSPHTCALHQNNLIRMLNKAVGEGLLDKNPFYSLEKKQLIHAPKPDKVYLDKAELAAIAAASATNDVTKSAFLFCCLTGLRYSDVKALTWRQITTVNGTPMLSIRAMKKTGKPVTVPLNKSALTWLPDRTNAKPNEPVFRLGCLSACDRCLKKLAEAAGITKVISFHTSRHTFAVLSLSAGGELLTVSRLMGHTSVHSTQVYADLLPETRLAAISQIDSYFNNVRGKGKDFQTP